MSKKPRKKKKFSSKSKYRALESFFKGVVVTWTVKDPLAETHVNDIYDTKMTHKKVQYLPVIQTALAREHIRAGYHSWVIDIDILCRDDDKGEDYEKGVQISATCRFHDIDDEMAAQIEALLAGCNMRHYQKTRMTCEIV